MVQVVSDRGWGMRRCRSGAPTRAHMASYSGAIADATAAVSRLVEQFDEVYVYLNDIYEVPAGMRHPRVTVTLGPYALGDLRDNGKLFHLNHRLPGVDFLVDDDIVYPDDYVPVMQSWLDLLKPGSIVGVHGRIFARDATDYSDAISVIHFERRQPWLQPVSILGTGTVAFHSGTVSLRAEDLTSTGLLDVHFGAWCAIHDRMQLAVPRPDRWLTSAPRGGPACPTLYEESKSDKAKVHEELRRVLPTFSADRVLERIIDATRDFERVPLAALIALVTPHVGVAATAFLVDAILGNLGPTVKGRVAPGDVGRNPSLALVKALGDSSSSCQPPNRPGSLAHLLQIPHTPTGARLVVRGLLNSCVDGTSFDSLLTLFMDLQYTSPEIAKELADAVCRSRQLQSLDAAVEHLPSDSERMAVAKGAIRSRHHSLMEYRRRKAGKAGHCFAATGPCAEFERISEMMSRQQAPLSSEMFRDEPLDVKPSEPQSRRADSLATRDVSVIMVVRNAQTTVGASVLSLIDQELPPREVLVIDDDSDDGTFETVLALAHAHREIRLCRLSRRMGPYYGRNLGLKYSVGSFITFQDADDIALPHRIHRQRVEFDRNQSIWMCVGHHLRVDASGVPLRENHGFYLGEGPVTSMFRRSLVTVVGYFDVVLTRADNEFRDRVRTVLGPTAIGEVHSVLELCAVSGGNNSFSYDGASLRRYRQAFKAWHEAQGKASYMPWNPILRPFPAPTSLLPPSWPSLPEAAWF